ncbi:hypothetical protein [Rhodococcus jostii]|uniref:hypothetical protein n=1 Tax=Rhodococcus jostii TaxID=132919 RepID=UPI00142F30DA|nr:hypothetical protein [Rhodococcus jostii]
MAGYQLVQLPDAGRPLGEPPRCQPSPTLVHQMDIVMVTFATKKTEADSGMALNRDDLRFWH